jgi:SEC-C motif-containing protein
MVRFAAQYRQDGVRLVHHERSTFRREDGQWVYVDGEVDPKSPPRQVAKVGRNDPCPCGSGKKYKKCCGA